MSIIAKNHHSIAAKYAMDMEPVASFPFQLFRFLGCTLFGMDKKRPNCGLCPNVFPTPPLSETFGTTLNASLF